MVHGMSALIEGSLQRRQINSFKDHHQILAATHRQPRGGPCRASAVKPRSSNVADGVQHGPEQLDSASRHVERLERLWEISPLHSCSYTGSDPLWSHGIFLVSVDDKPPKTTKGQEKCPDYYANVGDAIRTLREDVPQLFERELNYDIYRDDITFRDPRNTFSGMKNYKLIFWSLRFHGRIFFKKLYVEVRRIWQPQDGLICMRWTVHGIPRVPWEAEGTFDGISQYKLDSEGKIYEHAVDNVILRDPPMQGIGPLLAGLNLVPGTPQQPVPGAWMKGLEEGAAAAAASAASFDSSSSWLDSTLLGSMQLQAAEQLLPATAAVPAAAAAAAADPA